MNSESAWIEVDTDFEEVMSQYDSCYSSGTDNTTTVGSEITNYKYENGRRYHAYSEGHYWAPNDEQQNNQLEIFHQVFSLTLEGLYKAPLMNPRRILDLGTGTGIWAIEMADLFPDAEVLGNDLSPVQPTWIPSNCTFEVDDFTKPWLHPSCTFDYIHARSIHGCASDWHKLLDEVYTKLTPGGWFENVETPIDFHNDNGKVGTALRRWTELTREAGAKSGRPFDKCFRMVSMMRRRGFTNITQEVYKVPVGPWAKDKRLKMIGKANLVNLLEACEGFALALFTRHLGWSLDKTQRLIGMVMSELRGLKDSREELYLKLIVVYGQRPVTDTTNSDEVDTTDVDSAYWSTQSAMS